MSELRVLHYNFLCPLKKSYQSEKSFNEKPFQPKNSMEIRVSKPLTFRLLETSQVKPD
jgi:hypothetical protein